MTASPLVSPLLLIGYLRQITRVLICNAAHRLRRHCSDVTCAFKHDITMTTGKSCTTCPSLLGFEPERLTKIVGDLQMQ